MEWIKEQVQLLLLFVSKIKLTDSCVHRTAKVSLRNRKELMKFTSCKLLPKKKKEEGEADDGALLFYGNSSPEYVK